MRVRTTIVGYGPSATPGSIVMLMTPPLTVTFAPLGASTPSSVSSAGSVIVIMFGLLLSVMVADSPTNSPYRPPPQKPDQA